MIDATGPAGLVPHALATRRLDDTLKTRSHAIFSHFERVPLWQNMVEEAGGRIHDYP